MREVLKPVYPKAVPTIVKTVEEVDVWQCASSAEVKALQRPLPAELLTTVAKGRRRDPMEATG